MRFNDFVLKRRKTPYWNCTLEGKLLMFPMTFWIVNPTDVITIGRILVQDSLDKTKCDTGTEGERRFRENL